MPKAISIFINSKQSGRFRGQVPWLYCTDTQLKMILCDPINGKQRFFYCLLNPVPLVDVINGQLKLSPRLTGHPRLPFLAEFGEGLIFSNVPTGKITNEPKDV